MTEMLTLAIPWMGLIIISLAAVQVGILVYSSIDKRIRERQYHRLAQAEWVEQTEKAAAGRQQDEGKTAWNGTRKFQVADKVDEGGSITSFYLEPHDRQPLPSFRPGQYLTFKLRIPGQEKTTIRCYSLSDSPRSNRYRVSIKRVGPPRDKPEAPPGLSSNFFHDTVVSGDILDVNAPSGHFSLDTESERPVVLIGGGVGLTPVLSMLNSIAETGAKRETHFFYGVRNGQEHIMRDHLNELRQRGPNIHVHVVYSSPDDDNQAGRDYDHTGHIGVDLFKEVLPSNNYEFYICGPPPMMQAVTQQLADWGVPEQDIHFEAFGPATVKKTQKPETHTGEPKQEFTVRFRKAGKEATWTEDKGSLLDLAEACGITIESGCRAGNCGTCATALRAGRIRYLSEPGAEEETGSCFTCVAVPTEAVELDA